MTFPVSERGNSGSRRNAVSMMGTPSIMSMRSTTVRPRAGNAGLRRTLVAPVALIRASTSGPTWPRSVESIFLKIRSAGAAATAAAARWAAVGPSSVRVSVSTARVVAGTGVRGQTVTGTGCLAANSAPVSHAPVRSSARMVSTARGGVMEFA